MNRSDLLVPLNVEKHCFEGLKFAARMAREMPIRTTLLYVVELNVFPFESRIYGELRNEYTQRLRNLALCCFDFGNEPAVRVRIGRAHEEILTEARENNPELIVMSGSGNQRKRWPFRAGTVERVVRDAPCLTLVVSDSAEYAVTEYGQVRWARIGNE